MKKSIIAMLSAVGLVASAAVAPLAAAQEMPGKGVTVRPFEGPLPQEKFQHKILYRALEELGYTVAAPQSGQYTDMHAAVAAGTADFSAAHWDPLHHHMMDDVGGETVLDHVGSLVEIALQGYLVDKASYDLGIRNLGDLADPKTAKRFDTDGDGKADMVGCNTFKEWGCERVINHHLAEYGLGDTVEHVPGDYDNLIQGVVARYNEGKPIFYYAWSPYWVQGELEAGDEVEYLEVPYSSLPDGRTDNTVFSGKNLGFAVNTQRVVANVQFLNNNPAAAALFEVAAIQTSDISKQNYEMYEGESSESDINRHVDAWIFENRSKFDGWLKVARDAR